MSNNLVIRDFSSDDIEDDDEDEWGTHELIIDRVTSGNKSENNKAGSGGAKLNTNEEEEVDNEVDAYFQSDEYWNGDDEKSKEQSKSSQNEHDDISSSTVNDNGVPMFIIDVTRLNPDIHSKYDRNSVNDPFGASKIRRKFEKDFHQLHKNAEFIANGTIVPCSTSIWQSALSRMRDERKGHYFLPIFPPK